MTKPKRACSVEGCGRAVKAYGWCEAHYRRNRKHGDPLGGGTRRGELLVFLDEVVSTFDSDECLIWPFAKDGSGYGQVRRNGKKHLAHRIVCEREHGPPPTPKHDAAHLCGKGHLGCVNRHHLEWKTRAENQADRVLHGTSNRGERSSTAKLTESQVLEIRASTKLQRELAEEYGVSSSSVNGIKLRRSWTWLGAS